MHDLFILNMYDLTKIICAIYQQISISAEFFLFTLSGVQTPELASQIQTRCGFSHLVFLN